MTALRLALVAAVAFGLGALVGSGVAHVLDGLDGFEVTFDE